MKNHHRFFLGMVCGLAGLVSAPAMERFFTYTYEPETMPKGALEYEQWIGLRAGRNKTAGQDDFNLWEFRHEFEYGVTDDFSLSLYLNESLTNFRQRLPARGVSRFRFDRVSLENKYLLMNPADHAAGVTLYVEPRHAGDGGELEEKIIVGQRHGDWKWAVNVTHATEWSRDWHMTEGEVEVSFGITGRLSARWSAGIEAREHNELPDYRTWENTAFYLGPAVTYQRDRWWATLTVMPQVAGANFAGNADGNHQLDLEGHERWNARLIAGFSF